MHSKGAHVCTVLSTGPVKVMHSGEEEGGWSTEPHFEATCEKGSPKRERAAACSICNTRDADECLGLG